MAKFIKDPTKIKSISTGVCQTMMKVAGEKLQQISTDVVQNAGGLNCSMSSGEDVSKEVHYRVGSCHNKSCVRYEITDRNAGWHRTSLQT